MMIGGTGTGKSTYAKKLKKDLGINIVSADEIQRRNRNLTDSEVDERTYEDYLSNLNGDSSFIIDGKCLNTRTRKGYISDAQKNGFTVLGYDFGCGTVVSLLRRLAHPRRFSKKYWEDIYEDDNLKEFIILLSDIHLQIPVC
jgi:predicted kinase